MNWQKLKPISDKVLERFRREAKPTEEWSVRVSPEEVEGFAQRHGRRAVPGALKKLGKYRLHYNILTSELGQHLLGDDLDQCNTFLMKIINEKATAADRAEYRAYRRIIDRKLERIYAYIRTAEKVKGI